MANYIKREIENFEYNKRHYVPNEHRWCFMYDDENHKEYFKKKSEESKPKTGRVQSNPETTGQWGTML